MINDIKSKNESILANVILERWEKEKKEMEEKSATSWKKRQEYFVEQKRKYQQKQTTSSSPTAPSARTTFDPHLSPVPGNGNAAPRLPQTPHPQQSRNISNSRHERGRVRGGGRGRGSHVSRRYESDC